jgi:hypothetical protein
MAREGEFVSSPAIFIHGAAGGHAPSLTVLKLAPAKRALR